MDSYFWFDAIYLGWFIVYTEGSQLIHSTKNVYLSLKIVFVVANSVDHDEIPREAAFHLVLHCCQSTHSGATIIERVKQYPCFNICGCLSSNILFCNVMGWFVICDCGITWPRGYTTCSCSTQLSTKFVLLINVKIIGILTFISMINTIFERVELSMKTFYNLGAWSYSFAFGLVFDSLTFLLDNSFMRLAQCCIDKL